MLPEIVVEPAPESFALFLFNNSKDIFFCGFATLGLAPLRDNSSGVAAGGVACVFESNCNQVKFDVFNGELKWSIVLTSPCGAA